YFYELVKDIYTDLDGSTDRTEGDFYGMAQGHYSLGPYLYSFDNPIVKKDEDGVPTLSLKTDKINQIVSKLYDSCFNTQGIYYNKDVWSGQEMFLEKRAVFTIASIGSLVNDSFRNFDDEYGVLPLPKWDENQQKYLTGVGGEHTATAVPKTVKDTEFVGIITEALAAESYKHVTPTYYEIALKTRYLRDNESKKVLDIIIDGTTYDFGYVFNGWQSPLSGTLEHLFQDANSNFESYYNKHYQTSRLHFRAIIKCFDRLR
ncbi:MAG: hypothetical protein IIV81_00750, partial [Clostridia bacterium]|nr:hypothetical protein [Clostridia bacterium]